VRDGVVECWACGVVGEERRGDGGVDCGAACCFGVSCYVGCKGGEVRRLEILRRDGGWGGHGRGERILV
jgi:hypothetical protein